MYDLTQANPVYAGHLTVAVKPTVSMRSKKRSYIPFSEREIIRNTHEPIITQTQWDNVQTILNGHSGSFITTKTEYENIFKGVIKCADCKSSMLVKVEHKRRRDNVLDQTFYCCTKYRKYGVNACQSHNVEARLVHETVLADIQKHARQAVSDYTKMVDEIAGKMKLQMSAEQNRAKSERRKYRLRIAEIENLYAKLYEDLAKGLLTESRFKMLAEKYDREQAELNEAIHSIDRTREQEQDQLSDIRQFVTEVGGYAGITELNYSIIHKLIDKIYIFQAEEVDGEKIQRLKICYKFVGSLEEKPE